MKLVIEPGDFPAESGKTPEALSDPIYAWSLLVKHFPDGRTVPLFYHRGATHELRNVEVEIVGAESVEPVAEAPKPKKKRTKKAAEREPVTAGGATLQDLTDWYE